MPAEAPAAVQANVEPHLTSLGVPTELQPAFFQALAAAGYNVQGEEEPDPAIIVDSVPCTVKQVAGRPGTYLITVTDGDVELRWIEWHAKDGTVTRSSVPAVVTA